MDKNQQLNLEKYSIYHHDYDGDYIIIVNEKTNEQIAIHYDKLESILDPLFYSEERHNRDGV